MANTTYRKKLVELAKKHNVYFVLWFGHSGDSFCIIDRKSRPDRLPEIYSAIFESFYDLTEGDQMISIFNKGRTWKENYEKVKAELDKRIQTNWRISYVDSSGKSHGCVFQSKYVAFQDALNECTDWLNMNQEEKDNITCFELVQ